MIAGTMPRWQRYTHRSSLLVLALFGALIWVGFHFSSSVGQNPQARKGLTLVVVWMILVALGFILAGFSFWGRLITEFSYDGRTLRLSTLGVPEMQTRHLSEIAEVSEWRGRGGPLGYRIKFRDGAKFYLQNGVSNAAAVAEQIRNDLLGQPYGSFISEGTSAMNRRPIYLVFLIIAALCAGWLAFRFTMKLTQQLPTEITPAAFLSEVAQGNVAKIRIADRQFISGVSSTRGAFRTKMRLDDAVVKELRSRGVVVEFERETGGLE